MQQWNFMMLSEYMPFISLKYPMAKRTAYGFVSERHMDMMCLSK